MREAHRVVKRGGRIWGSAISRFAPVLDSVSHGFFADPTFLEILHRDIEEGQHRNRTNNPLYFTDAFLHRPEDLRYEFTEAGFQVVEIVGIEGPGWLSAAELAFAAPSGEPHTSSPVKLGLAGAHAKLEK